MDVTNPAWKQARQAWRRLLRYLPTLDPGPAGDPLSGLSDIGVIRRQLDQAELASVRAARIGGKSWAEIATNLGITRQSAWERWRELDESLQAPLRTAHRSEVLDGSLAAAVTPLDAAVRELTRGGRRKRKAAPISVEMVAVPDVVAFNAADASEALLRAGLIGLVHTTRGKSVPLGASSDGVVADQVPTAGARRRVGSSVTVWIERGGGSAGVREPRRPAPTPRSALAHDAPVDDDPADTFAVDRAS